MPMKLELRRADQLQLNDRVFYGGGSWRVDKVTACADNHLHIVCSWHGIGDNPIAPETRFVATHRADTLWWVRY